MSMQEVQEGNQVWWVYWQDVVLQLEVEQDEAHKRGGNIEWIDK